MRLSSLG
jgi:hypothetical protein